MGLPILLVIPQALFRILFPVAPLGFRQLGSIPFPVTPLGLRQLGSIPFPVTLITLSHALWILCLVALAGRRHLFTIFFPVTLVGHRDELSIVFSVLFSAVWVFGPIPFTFGPHLEYLALTFRQKPLLSGGYSVGMPGPVPRLSGQLLQLFSLKVGQFVVVVVVVVVVVGVIVGVVGGVIVVVVALMVADWGSLTAAAELSYAGHRERVAVLGEVWLAA